MRKDALGQCVRGRYRRQLMNTALVTRKRESCHAVRQHPAAGQQAATHQLVVWLAILLQRDLILLLLGHVRHEVSWSGNGLCVDHVDATGGRFRVEEERLV